MQIISRSLKGTDYYKSKGVVTKVLKRFVAEISVFNNDKDTLQVDQAELETVLPQPGGTVKILQGPYNGVLATLLSINEDEFKASVRLKDGRQAGKVLSLEYEAISKVAEV